MSRRSPATTAARIALVLVISVLGAACGGDDDGDDVAAAGSTTSSSVAGGSTTTAAPGGETTTTAAAGSDTTVGGSATTARPAATAPPATPAPGPAPLTPPAPGTYRYATSGQTTVTGAPLPIPPLPYPPLTTNQVDPAAGTRQHMRRNLQDGAGNGSIVDYIFDYRPDGIYLESLRFTITLSGQTNVQDLTPPAPLLFLATGAEPGASRTLAIPIGGGGGVAQVVVSVPGREQVTIGGQSIDTLVVRSVATLPPGDITGTQTLTVNLDPGTRIWVKESGAGDGTAVVAGVGTLRVQTTYAATLQSLTPG